MLLVINLFLDALDLVKLGKYKNYEMLFLIFSFLFGNLQFFCA
jgi:hypothetical protein